MNQQEQETLKKTRLWIAQILVKSILKDIQKQEVLDELEKRIQAENLSANKDHPRYCCLHGRFRKNNI